ncbi:lipoprotein [Mesoplasma photuris]|uniref:lipoprotein n=1 Tax=Mesoplasma photuris TaxID=217731 RepID=UPI0004E1F78A|nr:lipoprotein [Mesoplasma photuris]
MKKLLSVLAAVTMITTTTASVVACAPREPKNVIIEIDQDVLASTKPAVAQIKTIADDFNKLLEAGGQTNIRVEVESAPKGGIVKKMFANEALPNLYMSYPDSTTMYETQFPDKGKVVDMREVIDWDTKWLEKTGTGPTLTDLEQSTLEAYAHNSDNANKQEHDMWKTGVSENITGVSSIYDKFGIDNEQEQYKPLTYSFIGEGMAANNKLYSAPIGKSMFSGTLNKKLLAEVFWVATGGEIDLEAALGIEDNETKSQENADGIWNIWDDALKRVVSPEKSDIFETGHDKTKIQDWDMGTVKSFEDLNGDNSQPINIYAGKDINELMTKWGSEIINAGDIKAQVKEIQYFMADADKVLTLLTAYKNILKAADIDPSDPESGNTYGQYFSYGIDDTGGWIYSSYRNTQGKELENKNSEIAKNIFTWKPGTEEDNYNGSFDFEINDQNEGSLKSLNNGLKFYEYMNLLAPFPDEEKHYGGLFGSGFDKAYSSDFFVDGTMLVSNGSTAGAQYVVKDTYYNKDKTDFATEIPGKIIKPGAVNAKDVMPIAPPTFYREIDPETGKEIAPEYTVRRQYGIQQGPGMGMFKSDNKEKNEISIAFLNYFMNNKNLTDYSIKGGYIPSHYNAYESRNQTAKEIAKSDDYFAKLNEVPIVNEIKDGDEIVGYVQKPTVSAAPFMKQVLQNIFDGEKIVQEPAKDESLTQEEAIRQDQGIMYSQGPSPYGNGMRFKVVDQFIKMRYGLKENANIGFTIENGETIVNPEIRKSQALNATNFFGDEMKTTIEAMVEETNLASNLTYESDHVKAIILNKRGRK